MNWETFPRVRVGVGYTTPMIPPELTHAASSEPSMRRRQYVAPSHELPNDVEHTSNHHHHHHNNNGNNNDNNNNNNNNNNNSHIYHSHSRHATQIVIPPSSPQVTPNNTNNNNGRYRDPPHDTTSHPCGNHSHEEHQKATRIRMFLPVSFPETTESGERRDHELHSWRDLPPNPLNGLPGLTTQVAPVGREDCRFYCDSCQKGFYTQDRYDKHMTDHIWCTVPGCRFTCRKGKEWKMEIHMETLHNRPDAPNLADVETYLSQRKARFPTQVSVKSKVEELFYKASRGVALPEERRRWLRQHGILVRKHPRTEETYIDLDALRPSTRTVASKATERNPVKQRLEKKQGDTEEQEDEDEEKEDDEAEDDEEAAEEEGTREMNIPSPTIASGEAVQDTHAREHPSALAQQQQHPPRGGRPKRIVPRGPNGTLTRGQQVQLVREKYKGATTVPRFYVCHRCGAKGAHWVDDCPTRGDSAFERQTVWGEERREPPRRKQRVEVDAGEEKAAQNINANECPSPGGEEVKSLRADDPVALEIVEDNDGGPPAEMPARRQAAEEAVVEVTRVIAPAAAAASVKKGRKTPQLQQGHGRHPESSVSQPQSQSRPRARPRRPPPPTLYERLLEGREVNERGLLLQAIRFFVMRKFFEPF